MLYLMVSEKGVVFSCFLKRRFVFDIDFIFDCDFVLFVNGVIKILFRLLLYIYFIVVNTFVNGFLFLKLIFYLRTLWLGNSVTR